MFLVRHCLQSDSSFIGKVRNSYLIPELQDFWMEKNRKIAVPMLMVSGKFLYKNDSILNQLILRIPLSENNFMLLIQPVNGNTLETIESSLSWDSFLKWLENVSFRYINLYLPKIEIEGTYDIQEILNNMELSYLLGKKADLRKITNKNLTVGKVINKVHFQLEDSDMYPNNTTDFPLNNDDQIQPLEIKLVNPFFFVVYEGISKALVFVARVENPLKTTLKKKKS
ncbi:hypothetical protein GDO86_009495 [Hymenochirus boettgeri]|uniref:Serpin domain-containing protein n=1 Tax=Hymenochirus boettgeri TaxID=247094 RepID=A0A8T2JGN0_9PIPI|nr:hypothetical protein GDO86_009495 [Hymenochirus boettgeri]